MAINKKSDHTTPSTPDNAMGDAFRQAGYQQQGQQGQQPPPNQQQQQQPQYQNNPPPPPQQPAPSRGVMDVNSYMRRPMARKSTGEVVAKYRDVLFKQMELNFKSGFENAFQMLVLDNNSANVGPLSSILICYNEVNAGQRYAAIYTLLVEGSCSGLNPRILNFGNRNVEIDTVAGDVYNEHLWAAIESHVTSAYGVKLMLLDAGQMVLPKELSPDDTEHLRRVVFNATQACFTVMEQAVGNRDHIFTIADIDKINEALVARVDYNPGDAESATGEPIRSDVRISLQGSIAKSAAGGFEQARDLIVLDGYVELVYSPPPPPVPGQIPITQYYYPRFVITRADTEIDAITFEWQLLALAQASLLSWNMGWSGVYRNRHAVKNIDTRDIGAIGWEVNLSDDPAAAPQRVDTKAKSFGDQQLYQLISTTIHDRLIYAMDIEEVGELSWIHQAYIGSANKDINAYNLIIEAADQLTNGHFRQFFNFGHPICYDNNNRIHMGFYPDEEGIRRDIRNIDPLGLLNIAGKTDPEVVVKWSESLDNMTIPMEIRLETRANILKAIFPRVLNIKGYGRRITFDPHFMASLNSACAAAGLDIRPNNLIQDYSGMGVRGNRTAGLYSVGPQDVSGVFNYNQNAYGNPRNGFSNMNTIWARNNQQR